MSQELHHKVMSGILDAQRAKVFHRDKACEMAVSNTPTAKGWLDWHQRKLQDYIFLEDELRKLLK